MEIKQISCPIISSIKTSYLDPVPLQILGPSKPENSDSSSFDKAKLYLSSLQPCPTLHPFCCPNESIERLLDIGYSVFDRTTQGTQSAPASPRRGEEALPQRFPHLLSTIEFDDDFSTVRQIPSAKDRLGVFVPSFSFPMVDVKKKLPFDPYNRPQDGLSN